MSVVSWFAVRRMAGPPVWWRHVLVPALGAAVAVAVIVEASRAAQVVGAVWLVVGLVVVVGGGGAGPGPVSVPAASLRTWL